MRLARVGIHARRGVAGLRPRRASTAGRLRVAGTLLSLGLPVVADLLERVLERAQRDAMGGLAVAVVLLGRFQGVDVGLLRLRRRPLEGRREAFLLLLVQ